VTEAPAGADGGDQTQGQAAAGAQGHQGVDRDAGRACESLDAPPP
jgi:hypothetical protein